MTKRLHVITQNLPYFMCRLFGNITTYGGEETIIDPKKKILSIHSKNLSFTRQATALDTSSYTVCPTDPSKTLYVKSTTTYGSYSKSFSTIRLKSGMLTTKVTTSRRE